MGAQPEGSEPLNIKLPRDEWQSYADRAHRRGTHPTTVIKDRIMDGLDLVDLGEKLPKLDEVEDIAITTDPKTGKPRRRNVGMVTKPYWLPTEHADRVRALSESTGWYVVRVSRALLHLGETIEADRQKVRQQKAARAAKRSQKVGA